MYKVDTKPKSIFPCTLYKLPTAKPANKTQHLDNKSNSNSLADYTFENSRIVPSKD